MPEPEPAPNLANIQGNVLAGFSKDFQCFLFLGFPAGGDPRGWLRAIVGEVATSEEVQAFNALFKAVNARRGAELGTVKATWLNLALSAAGLAALGVPEAELEAFPASFRAGMAAQAATIGDVNANAPENWVRPFGSDEVHAMLLLASDDPQDLDAAVLRQTARLGEHDLRLLFTQDGRARSDLPGREHFGFKDGVSQPAIHGFTPEGAAGSDRDPAGQPLIWPGEFVLGYQTQQGPPSPPPPIPEPPDYTQPNGAEPQPLSAPEASAEPGPVAQAGPPWTKDGSFLVFRRLRQDVPAFEAFLAQNAAAERISPELLGAKLVGRYRSGCPLEHTSDEPAALDTQIADPSEADASLLADPKVNRFDYTADPDGAIVPRAAHIRKVNPRNETAPGGIAATTNLHRIIRRGIAFGEPYDPGAPPGSPRAAEVAFPVDRGLLFLCYQASIEQGFEFLQRLWVNNFNFPEPGDGQDPIIAQAAEPRSVSVPGLGSAVLAIPQFVTTTGGEYFFSPSITAIETLAAPPS